MAAGNEERPKRIVLDRSWRADGSGTDVLPPLPCNLKKAMPCCGGRGYQVAPSGAIARATLCTCVTGCAACLGRARQLEGNDSRPCRTPAPNVVANLINAAMIPARYADATVERFRNFTGNGREVLGEVQRWRRGFTPIGSRGLVIEGPVGVGKTFLLAALAKDLAERGQSVRFTDFFQLLGEIKSGFAEGKADATQLAPLVDVDVLFIDELGKGRNNDFELAVLDQLICGRYNQGKTIIASTNYRLKGRGYDFNVDLDKHDQGGGPGGGFASDRFVTLEQRIGQRIFSRLKEMTNFLELSGDDFRRRDPYQA